MQLFQRAIRYNSDKLNVCISYDPSIPPLSIHLALTLGHLHGWSSQLSGDTALEGPWVPITGRADKSSGLKAHRGVVQQPEAKT